MRDGTLVLDIEGSASTWTISVAGELDMANAASLATELKRAEQGGAETIVIDMRDLEFIDSTGIAVLVAAHRRLNLNARTERVLLVRSKASGVRRVMDLTGLDDELPFVATDESG
ncbi:MAG TPA: STAS domain-containing protein [Solirubrobacterales bacterium]|nr:STAS domain-containing protein [Solirubrobacterales bacterium]